DELLAVDIEDRPFGCGRCLAQLQDVRIEMAGALEIMHKKAHSVQGLEDCAHRRIPFLPCACSRLCIPPITTKQDANGWTEPEATAVLVLADGTVLEGVGFGATGRAVGEVCFNTAMTGYEEILTDPSYAGQIITFTFPHIGNVGTNEEDIETVNM